MDRVLVTLKYADFEGDFELPCTVRLGELYPRLTAALQSIRLINSGSGTTFLEKDGSMLTDPNASLADYGVCDGNILYICRGG